MLAQISSNLGAKSLRGFDAIRKRSLEPKFEVS
jgi:hypothetical protein